MVQFIDFRPIDQSFTPPARRWRFLRRKKFWIPLLSVLVTICLLSYFFLYRPAQALYQELQTARDIGNKLTVDFTDQDVVAASADLDSLESSLDRSRQKLDAFGFLGNLPWLGDFYRDGRHILLAGQYGTEAGHVVTDALRPYAADISFKNGKQVTTEQKIQAILPIMPKIAPATDGVSAKLTLVKSELNSVDPNRYPATIFNYQPRSMLASAKEWVDKISSFMPEAKQVLTIVPGALGSPATKKYFVLFQNDKELRPTGGFLTAYTYATFSKGIITANGSQNITVIDTSMSRTFPAPTPILRYLPLVYAWYPRDSNLSPDFVTSMNKFDQLARYSSAYASNDGIIAVDTFLLQDLLRLTGPVKTPSTGDSFSADDVVVKMETYAEQVFSGNNNRKAFLGELMKEVLHRLLSAGKDQWQPILDTAIRNGNEKHFLLYSRDAAVQSLIEKYDWGGRIKDYNGDYFHLNDSNFAGAKANLYITEKIAQDITVGSDGTVTKKVTVTETNTGKYDGWLNGTYRDWVRMYVPSGSTLTTTDGTVKTASTDLGKTYFENFITVIPTGFNKPNYTTWTVTYTLPNKLTGRTYSLLMQKQPGVEGPDITISVNGSVKVAEKLRTDKEFSINF